MSLNNPANPLKPSGGSNTSGITWEDITGRPDLSNVSERNVVEVTLVADGWNEDKEQTVTLSQLEADEAKQLLIPVPTSASFHDYYTADIMIVAQEETTITFQAVEIPENDCVVRIYIDGVVGVSTEEDGQVPCVWWSPMMTANDAPTPYVVSASSTYNNYAPWQAFDNDIVTGSDIWPSGDVYTENPWIQFDFGASTLIKGMRLHPPIAAKWKTYFPKSFYIQGSNDGASFDMLYDAENPYDYNIDSMTYRECEFSEMANYRYYRVTNRFNYNTDNTSILAYIQNIQFYRPESEVTS